MMLFKNYSFQIHTLFENVFKKQNIIKLYILCVIKLSQFRFLDEVSYKFDFQKILSA